MSAVVDITEAKKRLYKTHGDKISLLNYDGMSSYATFHCYTCNNPWDAICSSVTRKNGCPNCRIDNMKAVNKFEYQSVYDFILSKDCNLAQDFYINSKTNMLIKFSCGHTEPRSLEVFKRCEDGDFICKKCKRERTNESQRISMDILLSYFKEDKLDFIEFPNGYINRKSLVSYKCSQNHYTTHSLSCYLKNRHCSKCHKIITSLNQTGEKGSNWKGGRTTLRNNLRFVLSEWKEESMKNCNYKCVLSGLTFDEIHHVYPFDKILNEALEICNMDRVKDLSKLNYDELILIKQTVKDVHDKYPLGVCLTKEWHKKFHKEYGKLKFTVENWNEFYNKHKK